MWNKIIFKQLKESVNECIEFLKIDFKIKQTYRYQNKGNFNVTVN